MREVASLFHAFVNFVASPFPSVWYLRTILLTIRFQMAEGSIRWSQMEGCRVPTLPGHS